MEPSSADLRYFLEVVRVKSLSGAADSLGISQPSLTLAIQRLERCLGEKVLIRNRRGAVPTLAGRALLTSAKVLIETWDQVRVKVKGAEAELAGKINIGCHPEVAIDSLPLFLPFLLEHHPKLEVSLFHGLSKVVTEKVISGETDIGIVVNPKVHPDLIMRSLASDEVGLWVGPGRRSIQDIKSGNAVLFYDAELVQSQTLLKRAKRKGIQFSRLIHTGDMEVIASLVAAGSGLGILPSEVAERHPGLGLKKIPGLQAYTDEVVLIFRHENRATNSIQIVVSAILEGHRAKYGVRSRT